jgi:hypothetical protein
VTASTDILVRTTTDIGARFLSGLDYLATTPAALPAGDVETVRRVVDSLRQIAGGTGYLGRSS